MTDSSERLRMSYSDRSKLALNKCAKELFELMERKKTNLGLAADFYNIHQLFKIIDLIGPHIAVLKTHMDLMNYEPVSSEENQLEVLGIETSLKKLSDASKKYDFEIFEDRKFADIGGVDKRQYESGIFHIASWSHMTNAHVLPGPGVISGLYEAAQPYIQRGEQRGLILLPYMTPEGNLFTKTLARKIIRMGKKYPEFVMGWIGAGEPAGKLEHEVEETPIGTLILTPGCKFPITASDNIKHGQVYTDPRNLISRGSDIIIVGSGIYQANDPVKETQIYRDAGWEAYEDRIR